MAKISLTDVTSGYASTTAVNANNALIEAEFDNTLSRDGTGPNQMEANLDMNGNLILNSGNAIQVSGFTWEGPWITTTSYSVGDIVENGGSAYMCIVAHTSGTFATDLAAAKWQLFASASLPSQTGNTGEFLQTDGATLSWAALNTGDVSFTHSATGAVSRPLTGKFSEIVSVFDFMTSAEIADVQANTTLVDVTAAVQAALDVGGTIYFPSGTYLVQDSYNIQNGVVLQAVSNSYIYGDGDTSVLSLGTHSTTHHNIIRTDGCSNVTITRLKLDGNYAVQLGASDEYSHAIRIVDGAQNVTVEDCTIVDARGDGVYVGYENTPSANTAKIDVLRNRVSGCTRQQITYTHCNEGTIEGNRVSGTIDIEPDTTYGKIAGLKILNNTGIVDDVAGTVPQLSDLDINIYTPDGQGYKMNDLLVHGNTALKIWVQYAYGMQITGNTLVGSNASQTELLKVRGSEHVTITGNTFIANTAVATALVACYYDNINNNTICTGNTADTDSIPFLKQDRGTLSSVTSVPAKLRNFGNQISGTTSTTSATAGSYFHNEALFKLEIEGATLAADVVYRITQLSGQPLNVSATTAGGYLQLTSNTNDALYEFLPRCNAGTPGTSSGATTFLQSCGAILRVWNPAGASYCEFELFYGTGTAAPATGFVILNASYEGTFFFRAYF